MPASIRATAEKEVTQVSSHQAASFPALLPVLKRSQAPNQPPQISTAPTVPNVPTPAALAATGTAPALLIVHAAPQTPARTQSMSYTNYSAQTTLISVPMPTPPNVYLIEHHRRIDHARLRCRLMDVKPGDAEAFDDENPWVALSEWKYQ